MADQTTLKLLTQVRAWATGTGGAHARMFDGSADIFMTQQQLQDIDPLLPSLIYHHGGNTPGKFLVDGRTVATTVLFWHDLALCPNSFFESYIADIKDIERVDDALDQVRCKAYYFTVYSRENGALHPKGILRAGGLRDLVVRSTWMDSQFPGWKERYLHATSLGLDSERSARWVCYPDASDVNAAQTPGALPADLGF